MTEKRKVLFFTSPEVGGAERMTITIAKILNQEQYDVKFVIIGKEKGNIVNFIPSQFPVSIIKISNIYDFTTLKLYRLMRKEKPDVVFGSLIYLNVRIIQAAKWVGGIKVIVRNNIGLNHKKAFTIKLCRWIYPKADVIIAQQDEMRDEIIRVLGIDSNKVITLHNLLDTKTINAKAAAPSPYESDNIIRFVWVGRVSHEKGHDILINAFAKIKEHLPNSKLYFIGKYNESGEYYQSLKLLVAKLQLNKDICFIGYDSNPYRWVRHCSCFVQPSRLEGLPNALIEAMYLGRPVVATRCIPVVDRIVKDGYNGYIVKPDDIDALAEAMTKALELKDYTMTYHSAKKEDFIQLFNK